MNRKFAEIAGWYGTVALILAYLFVSFGVVEPDSISYQFLNLTGGLGIIVIALKKKVYQSVVVNIFWSGIAILALIKIFLS